MRGANKVTRGVLTRGSNSKLSPPNPMSEKVSLKLNRSLLQFCGANVYWFIFLIIILWRGIIRPIKLICQHPQIKRALVSELPYCMPYNSFRVSCMGSCCARQERKCNTEFLYMAVGKYRSKISIKSTRLDHVTSHVTYSKSFIVRKR